MESGSVDVSTEGSLSIGEALGRHYLRHGLPSDGGVTADWFRVRIGPIVIPLPNPPARKRAVFFHDVNHVATGYNTVFSDGEMLIAAYELGCGCGPFPIAWAINLGVFAVGLVARPRSLFSAFVRGRRAKSVYDWPVRDALTSMTVASLRSALGVPSEVPSARLGDRALFIAWTVAALSVTLGPIALIVAAVGFL